MSEPQPSEATPANRRDINPIDIHVGSRVKLRRTMAGFSQEKLGEAIGVTFQQIQKYEKGTNRVSASRMSQIADALQVPIAYFFEGAPTAGLEQAEPEAGTMHEAQAPYATELVSPEAMALNRAFVRVRSSQVRKRIVDMVKAIADSDDAR